MYKLKQRSGFTLVELLVVIAIIAILSAVVMINYGSIQKKSRGNQAKTDIANMTTSLETYKASRNNLIDSSLIGPHTSTSVSSWNTFWNKVNGCNANSCPTPPKGSNIVYIANVSSSDYYLCAQGGNIVNALSSGNTVWVGHNGNFYESTSCPTL